MLTNSVGQEIRRNTVVMSCICYVVWDLSWELSNALGLKFSRNFFTYMFGAWLR